MDPITLKLSNFLSYRDETLDFRPISTAALVGANGSGKSSVLDAILYALFGESTKGGLRTLDHHVTRGESECLVTLEFQLHRHTYRVIRGRSVARNKSSLEFAIQDGAGWRALGGKTLSEVQAAIEGTLRMDYRTFTSSSVILQGRSDSFTSDMTDAERKEALARILGLDVWDRVQAAAKDRGRELQANLAGLEAQARHHRDIALGRPALAAQQQLDTESLAKTTAVLAIATTKVGELEIQLAQQPVCERQLAEAREAERKAAARAEQAERDIATADAGGKRTQVEADRETAAIVVETDRLQGLLRRREEIDQAVACEADVAADVAEYERRALERMRRSDEAAALERRTADWDKQIETQVARLEEAIKARRTQAATLDQVPCTGEQRSACRLLGVARQAAAEIGELEARLSELGAATNPHSEAWQHAVQARDATHYDPDSHRAAKAALDELRLTARLKPALDAAAQRTAELAQRVAQVAAACQERLADFHRRRVAAEAARAEAAQDALAARDRMRALAAQLAALAPAQRELVEARAGLQELRALEARLRSTLGRLEGALAACDQAIDALRLAEAEAARAREELSVYVLLDQAAGRRGGVPALIIESAVPEVERLANAMLSRLAGGRLQLRLDTQAEGKSTGTMQEVLRITVCDQGSDRAYQTYSGAERFLADLALRVAISKFLAHRAGAEIRLFVLDEGVACCDPANRDAVMEAILAVAQDFAKVLVVTHLEELKDAFPQRLEVSKGSDGSKVRLT